MPLFTIPEVVHDLRREAVMLDTNVIYGAFSPGDSRHGDCLAYLDIEEQYVVPLPVVIETWGLLVGRDNDWESGLRFLAWLNDPSSGVVVVNHTEDIRSIQRLAKSARVDCVDA